MTFGVIWDIGLPYKVYLGSTKKAPQMQGFKKLYQNACNPFICVIHPVNVPLSIYGYKLLLYLFAFVFIYPSKFHCWIKAIALKLVRVIEVGYARTIILLQIVLIPTLPTFTIPPYCYSIVYQRVLIHFFLIYHTQQ